MPERKSKAEEENPQPKPKKPPGYRAFEKLLKQVVTSPPLRRVDGAKLRPDRQEN